MASRPFPVIASRRRSNPKSEATQKAKQANTRITSPLSGCNEERILKLAVKTPCRARLFLFFAFLYSAFWDAAKPTGASAMIQTPIR
jgi:hypothetical protein